MSDDPDRASRAGLSLAIFITALALLAYGLSLAWRPLGYIGAGLVLFFEYYRSET